MKILIVAPTPYFSNRGCHVRIYEEAKALTDKGHEVMVCTYHLGRNIGDFNIARSINIPWYKKTAAGPSWHKLYIDLLLTITAIKAARKFKPDIIHGHLHEGSLVGWVVKLITGKPLVFDYQGSLTSELKSHGFGKLLLPLFRVAEKLANHVPDKLIISNITAIKELESFGVNSSRITLLEDAIGGAGDRSVNLKEQFNLEKNDIIAIYLGVTTDYQGTDILVDTAEILSRENPLVKIIAFGFPEAEYKQRAHEKGLKNIIFPGALDYEASINTLNQAKIALSPKKAATEGNGKLFSYMLAGLPAVVFENEVNRSILGDNAFYCKKRDAAEYAKMILYALQNKEKFEQIKINLKESSLKYSWNNRINALVDLYGSLTGKSGEKQAPLKVLMLNYEFPPIGGGAANANYYMLKEFANDKRVEITLVTSAMKKEFIKFSDNVLIHKLPIKKKNPHFWTQLEVLSYMIRHYWYLKTKIDFKSYDLMHAFFTIPSGFLAFLNRRRLPYIISLRGSDVPGFNTRFSVQYVLLKPIIRKIWKKAAAVVANSDQLRSLAHETNSKQKIDVIYNGVSLDHFQDGKKSELPEIICVSRLIERKGINILIEAMPDIVKVVDCNLIIVGTGNLAENLKQLTKALGVADKVIFKDYIDHDKLGDYYSRSSLFILPSKNEGMSNALLEAMASGLPVITTDTGGTKELVENCGIVVEKDNSKSIAQAAIKVLENRDLREKMSKSSLEKAKKFSWKESTLDYYSTYKKIARDKGKC